MGYAFELFLQIDMWGKLLTLSIVEMDFHKGCVACVNQASRVDILRVARVYPHLIFTKVRKLLCRFVWGLEEDKCRDTQL